MKKLVIFIHGLGGNFKGAWGNLPEFIEEDEDLCDFDVGYFEYRTTRWGLRYKRCSSIDDLAQSLKTRIDNVYADYKDITLICHSMGGLIGMQYIIDCVNLRENCKVKKFMLYATPAFGSLIGLITKYLPFLSNTHAKQLYYGSGYINKLNSDWKKLDSGKIKIKLIRGAQDWVVDYLSNSLGGEPTERIENKTHTTVVKPKNVEDESYVVCKKFLLEKILPQKHQYQDVEYYIQRQLLPVLEDRQYSFLSTNKKTAIEVLKEHRHISIVACTGEGKSEELKHIAHIHSSNDSELYPFLCNLNKYTGGELLALIPFAYSDIPEERRLFILDGLDEVEPSHFYDCQRQIELLKSQFPLSYIIVSCRTNFYDITREPISGSLDGFCEYSLVELGYDEYSRYIEKRIGNDGKAEFFKLTYEADLNSYLKSPFYLVNLVSMFQDRGTIPRNKSNILGDFIESRLNSEINHFKDERGKDLRKNYKSILYAIEKLSLAMEIMGSNNINAEEVTQFIADNTIRELLEYGSFINKSNAGIPNEETWQYEHNNFQEYLAARALSNQSLKTIKEFIYDYKFNRIIPHWGNTVNFLVAIRNSNDLFEWLFDEQPEMLVSAGNDVLPESTKIKLFKKVFIKYTSKDIFIDTHYFRRKDLALLGQSDEGFEFLLYQDFNNLSNITLTETIGLLGEMEIPQKYRGKAGILLHKIAHCTTRGKYVQSNALAALSNQKELQLEKRLNFIAIRLKDAKSPYIRAGLYRLLNGSRYINKFMNIYIDGLSKLKNDKWLDDGASLVNESMNLQEGFKLASGDGLILLLKFLSEGYNIFRHAFSHQDSAIIAIIENAAQEYQENDDIFNIVYKLMLEMATFKPDQQKIMFFYKKTNTCHKAISMLLELEQIVIKTDCISMMLDEDTVSMLYSKYMAGEVDDSFIDNLLLKLKIYNGEKIYKIFYDGINDASGNKFILEETKSIEEIRHIKAQKDFNLLFDKDKFLYEVKRIFDGSEKLRFNDIIAMLYSDKNDFSMIILDELEHFTIIKDIESERSITYQEAHTICENYDWQGYSFHEIYNILKNFGDSVQTSEEQKEYIYSRCDYYFKKIDLRKIFNQCKEDSLPVIEVIEIAIFFLIRYKFLFSEKTITGLLFYDFPGDSRAWNGIEYLEEFIEERKLSSHIVYNLKNEDLNNIVFKNHIDYCTRHRLNDVLDIAQKKLVGKGNGYAYHDDAREACLKYLCSWGNCQFYLETVLEEIQDSFKWKIVETLVPLNSYACKVYLEKLMHTTSNKNDMYKAIRHALLLKSLDALKMFTSIIEECSECPTAIIDYKYNLYINNVDALPYYIRIFKKYYSFKYERVAFWDLGKSIREAFEQLALENEDNFVKVIEAMKKFIADNQDVHKINFLNKNIDTIEMEYYMKNSQSLSSEEVVEKLNKIL